MNTLRVGQQLTLFVENLSFGGGRGVARHQGFVLFIPDVIPNEEITIEITKLKKSFGEAKLIDVIKPSPSRISPKCQFYQKCGGCNWQHMDYKKQLEIKQNLFSDFLKPFPKIELKEIVPSPQEYNYRNRIQLHKKNDQLGYHTRGSHHLVNIDKCIIADDKINNYFADLKKAGNGRYEIFIDQQNNVSHRSQKSKVEADLFSQVNQQQNLQLIQTALSWISGLEPVKVLELFCGSGNFSFPLAQELQDTSLIAIDGSQKLINSALSKKSSINFICADLSKKLPSNLPSDYKPDLILLDPPRVGCNKTILENLISLSPKHFIYISCNPATLKRDLTILAESGYQPTKARAFDMFPQTDHIESMTFVSRL